MSASTREFHPGERTVARQKAIAMEDLQIITVRFDKLTSQLTNVEHEAIRIRNALNDIKRTMVESLAWLKASDAEIADDLQKSGFTVPDAPGVGEQEQEENQAEQPHG